MTNQSRRVRRKGAVPSRKMASKCERVDRISKLPDDILVSVISRLTVAEATSTSILSTRWRHLHTLIHRLVFCPSQQQISRIRKKHPKKLLAQIKEFTEYMKVIDGVLDSYVGILEEFRVDLPCLLGANMNKWLQFALERKVESIGIHIMSNNKLTTRDPHALMRYGGYYHFPRSALRNNAVVPGLESLKQLSLRGVHVQERDVSLFLLSLTGLESLSISFSEKLRKVRALGHSKLKILYISSCKNVESIEVSDMNNLASLICPDLGRFDQLRYQVLMPQLKLNNLPNLIHFEISDRRDQSLIDILPTIPSCIRNQLLHLKLTTDPSFIRLTSLENYKFHRFENLKHLELDIFMQCNKYSVRRLIPMISACPLLETIEIKVSD
ncbi:F-box protein At1g80960-like [Henckelia pumila]|uniref:F-box protein At1g80960-like n=1 Tax=Henckelia pumila TaxID=405737 RepID=UPI003C6E9F74